VVVKYKIIKLITVVSIICMSSRRLRIIRYAMLSASRIHYPCHVSKFINLLAHNY